MTSIFTLTLTLTQMSEQAKHLIMKILDNTVGIGYKIYDKRALKKLRKYQEEELKFETCGEITFQENSSPIPRRR